MLNLFFCFSAVKIIQERGAGGMVCAESVQSVAALLVLHAGGPGG